MPPKGWPRALWVIEAIGLLVAAVPGALTGYEPLIYGGFAVTVVAFAARMAIGHRQHKARMAELDALFDRPEREEW